MMALTVAKPARYRERYTEKPEGFLDQIDAAPSLDFLRKPPSNRLEKLRGDLADYWSLRINDQ